MTEGLRPSEVARRLGTSTRTVQRWITGGLLPARRVGGRWRVAFDALDAFSPPTPSREPRAIGSVFVANRGEIARRISATCRRLGLDVVVPATEGPDGLDLLDVEAVVRAAASAGADAVHPGFGFLAENAAFATAVAAAGLTWIGPPPAAIRAMGDKGSARRLAIDLGVPVVSGYDGADQADAGLTAAASEIGYPLLVKPTGGGGGKGMRVVRDAAALAAAIAGARREAVAAFGDDRLILERLVEGPRHVEVQVLFDSFGAGVHLGERDCSIQRRHQKVLEETPSPGVDPALRARLTDAALRLAAGVGYVSAGTCEFLVDDRGAFYFLEMNTRLQVEHPVTELVTGRDLVADQIRIAQGEPLSVDQSGVGFAGHAAEVRLYAEDAEDGFLPATGRVARLRWPKGDGIRVDAGIDEGTLIGPRFDPMLAKIVAHGADRAQALARLAAALDETTVLGVTTNLRFLRWLVRHPAVVDGQARIDTLDRIWPPDDWASRSEIPDAVWQLAAAELAAEGTRGWRLNAPPAVRVATDDDERRVAVVAATDIAEPLEAVRDEDTVHVDVAGRSVTFRLAPPPDVDRAVARAAGVGHGGGSVTAPMPGAVLAVHVAVGDDVDVGDPIATLEAMKMEHVVVAGIAGRIERLAVQPGDQVVRGQDVASITVSA